MSMAGEIKDTIWIIEEMTLRLRQASDDAWDYVNAHVQELVYKMTEIVDWTQQKINEGEEFPMDILLQQLQNLGEAYTQKDEVLLADTLEYEVSNALQVYVEQGEE
jgi:phage terminase small subunit